MRPEINFLSRSFDRPTIEESFSTMDPKSREIEKFGKGTQGKRKQQVRKSDSGIVKSSHLRCELLEACSLEQTEYFGLQNRYFGLQNKPLRISSSVSSFL